MFHIFGWHKDFRIVQCDFRCLWNQLVFCQRLTCLRSFMYARCYSLVNWILFGKHARCVGRWDSSVDPHLLVGGVRSVPTNPVEVKGQQELREIEDE